MSAKPRIIALFGSAVLFGQERGNIEALCALRDEGCEILCLVRADRWNVEITDELDRRGLAYRRCCYIEQWMRGRELHFIFRNPYRFLLANLQFAWWLARFRPTHLYGFNPFYVLNFAPVLSVVSVPLIYRAGDEPTRHSPLWRALWHFISKRTVRFVANSRFIEASLVKAGTPAEKVQVIYSRPPSRSPRELSNAEEEREAKGASVLFVGQLTPEKGVHILLEAFRQVAPRYPDSRLVVAGRISDWEGDSWARALRATATSDDAIAERVDFLGYVKDIPGLMSRARVHVAPSLWEEPLANVVLEAKAAAIPSIVFMSGGLPELIEHGVDGMVVTDKSSAALAAALELYLADAELSRRHGREAAASLRRLGVDRFATRWLSVFQGAGA